MKKKTIFIILFVSVFTLVGCGGASSITTEKDDSYDKKVQRVFVIGIIEDQLRRSVFYQPVPIGYNMIRAFNANVVEATIRVTSPESYSLIDYAKEAELFASDAIMQIDMNPFYSTRDDRNQAIVGHVFEASLIDMGTQKKVWHATGKVKYSKKIWLADGKVKYSEKDLQLLSSGAEMATAGAIVSAFITEVNGQKFVFWLPK